MFLSEIPEILSTQGKVQNSDQILGKFRFSRLERPNFPSPTVGLVRSSADPEPLIKSVKVLPRKPKLDSTCGMFLFNRY